jgi:hypothetical protein
MLPPWHTDLEQPHAGTHTDGLADVSLPPSTSPNPSINSPLQLPPPALFHWTAVCRLPVCNSLGTHHGHLVSLKMGRERVCLRTCACVCVCVCVRVCVSRIGRFLSHSPDFVHWPLLCCAVMTRTFRNGAAASECRQDLARMLAKGGGRRALCADEYTAFTGAGQWGWIS